MTALQPMPQSDARRTVRAMRIVVATDGSPESDRALELAATLARLPGTSVEVVSVCEIVADGDDVWSHLPPTELIESPDDVRARRAALAADQYAHRTHRTDLVMSQLQRALGYENAFPVTVLSGDVPRQIALFARTNGADLIITGRGRHTRRERQRGEEHLTRLLRATLCPVLAVERTGRDVPRTVVVGLDLSERDADVMAATTRLIPDDAHVYFVHVRPDRLLETSAAVSSMTQDDIRARSALAQRRDRSAFGSYPNTEIHVLTGHPGMELAAFAERVGADLVAVGIHGGGFVHRMILGSATTYLLRSLHASLLAVPPHSTGSPNSHFK